MYEGGSVWIESAMDQEDCSQQVNLVPNERRKKNNEAAKRSRDSRRAKEDSIALRAAYLEQENLNLKCELGQLRSDILRLLILSEFNK